MYSVSLQSLVLCWLGVTLDVCREPGLESKGYLGICAAVATLVSAYAEHRTVWYCMHGHLVASLLLMV